VSKIRLGFVGVGGMGQAAHLQNYIHLPDVEVVAIAELRERHRLAVARRWGIARSYANHEELLANERVDGLVCPQPFSIHGQLLPQLVDAGVPVISEKPIASSLAVAETIRDAFAAGRGTLYVAYHKRSDPATMHAKQVIESWRASGELGRLRYVRLIMPPGDWVGEGFRYNIKSDDPRPQFAHDPMPDELDEEAREQLLSFINYYIHQVNLLRHLFGEGYRCSHLDRSGVLLVAESESGVAGALEMQPFRSSRDWQESALVCFERGWIRIDLPYPLACMRPGTVTVFRDDGESEPSFTTPVLPQLGAMRVQAENFVRACRGEATPLCGAEDAVEDMRVAHQYLDLWQAHREAKEGVPA